MNMYVKPKRRQKIKSLPTVHQDDDEIFYTRCTVFTNRAGCCNQNDEIKNRNIYKYC